MSASQKIKEELYRFCSEFADARITRIQKQILEIQESMNSETKSSAGDKHETGRAMLQLEREKLGQQLLEAEKTQKHLGHIHINKKHDIIGPGSLVHTSLNSYFIAISAGEYTIENKLIYCISAATPMGRLLFGKCKGNQVVFKNVTINIQEVH